MRLFSVFLVLALCGTSPLNAGVIFEGSVTNNVIMGSGVTNGHWRIDRNDSGVELGLRAKLRHNAIGNPENTFNSNGAGTYNFNAGVAPTQSSPTAEWSFEWSINTAWPPNQTQFSLASLTYELAMTSTTGSFITAFDPINGINPAVGVVAWDHAIGDNSTAQSGGTSAVSPSDYAAKIAANNLAQNSWKPHWFATGFDPTVAGSYHFTLRAFHDNQGGPLEEVAFTEMTVNVVGASGAVPEPASLLIFASVMGMACAPVRRRRR